MARRLTISALWFVAFFCLHELAWSTFGSPRILGVAIGAFAAAFMWVDPLHMPRISLADRRALEPDLEPR